MNKHKNKRIVTVFSVSLSSVGPFGAGREIRGQNIECLMVRYGMEYLRMTCTRKKVITVF